MISRDEFKRCELMVEVEPDRVLAILAKAEEELKPLREEADAAYKTYQEVEELEHQINREIHGGYASRSFFDVFSFYPGSFENKIVAERRIASMSYGPYRLPENRVAFIAECEEGQTLKSYRAHIERWEKRAAQKEAYEQRLAIVKEQKAKKEKMEEKTKSRWSW